MFSLLVNLPAKETTMNQRSLGMPCGASLLCSALIASCASASRGDQARESEGVPYDPEVEEAHLSSALRHGEPVSAELQQEISQVLWSCYAVGADLVGAGDVTAAKRVLRKCYSDDMVFEAVMPEAYESLNFVASGGAEGFVNAANQIYRGMQFTRTQHLISNIVIEKTGRDTALVHSSAIAVHVYPDEHTFNATLKFEDEFERSNGQWKMTHRTMAVTSATQAAAWVP
jgi:hypothetical protein